MLRSAGALLRGAVRDAGGLAEQELPRALGRGRALAQRADTLAQAARDARAAAAQLDGIADEGIVQARAGALELAAALERPQAAPGRFARTASFDAPTTAALRAGDAGAATLELTSQGLDAAAAGRAAAWHLENSMARAPMAAKFEAARIVATAAPDQLTSGQLAWIPHRSELAIEGGGKAGFRYWRQFTPIERADMAQGNWRDFVLLGSGRDVQHVGTLRARFEQQARTMTGAEPRTPEWLARLDGDELIQLDEVQLVELDLLASKRSAGDVAELVLRQLNSDYRRAGAGFDRGVVTWEAARRMPADLRPDLPEQVIRDHGNGLALLKAGAVEAARARVAAGESPISVIAERLADESLWVASTQGNAVAHELLPSVRTLDEAAPLLDDLRSLVQRNVDRAEGRLRDGWQQHADYAEHGAATQLAETLAALEAAPRQVREPAPLLEVLTW